MTMTVRNPRDHVWDELALARDLTVEPLEGTTWRVSLTIAIPPEVQAALIRGGAKWRHTPAKRVRDFVKLGLRAFFSENDHAVPAPAGEANSKPIARREGLFGPAARIAARHGE